MKEPGFFRNYDTSVVIGVMLAVGLLIAWVNVGPGAALRSFLAEAMILAATFAVARQYLPWKDAPKDRLRGPRRELTIGLVGYALLLMGAVAYYRGQLAWPWLAVGLILPLVTMIAAGYSRRAWGLRMPKPAEVGVLAVVILATYGLSRLLGAALPMREAPAPQLFHFFGADLWMVAGELVERLSSSLRTGIAVVIAVTALEEIFFRVYLQPRLAAYLPGRWALFVQAVLYSAAFLPLYLIGSSYPAPYAFALVLVLTNGVMAGYFWRKTGNLWLLILLHLFAFPRYGL
jgi:membrane protease YdiL (CAAX protease family)